MILRKPQKPTPQGSAKPVTTARRRLLLAALPVSVPVALVVDTQGSPAGAGAPDVIDGGTPWGSRP